MKTSNAFRSLFSLTPSHFRSPSRSHEPPISRIILTFTAASFFSILFYISSCGIQLTLSSFLSLLLPPPSFFTSAQIFLNLQPHLPLFLSFSDHSFSRFRRHFFCSLLLYFSVQNPISFMVPSSFFIISPCCRRSLIPPFSLSSHLIADSPCTHFLSLISPFHSWTTNPLSRFSLFSISATHDLFLAQLFFSLSLCSSSLRSSSSSPLPSHSSPLIFSHPNPIQMTPHLASFTLSFFPSISLCSRSFYSPFSKSHCFFSTSPLLRLLFLCF